MRTYPANYRNPKRIMQFFLLLAVFYLAAGLCGMLIIKNIYIGERKNDALILSKFIAQSVIQGNRAPRFGNYIIKIYSADGSEISFGDEPAGRKNFRSVLPVPEEDIRRSLAPYMPRALAGQQTVEIIHLGKEKSKSLVCAAPIADNGSIRGTIFLIQSIADFQKMIRAYNLVFAVTTAAGMCIMSAFMLRYAGGTEKLEQMRREYISNVSHELKSPFASVRALTETLSDGVVSDESVKQRYYAIMLNECRRGEKLVQDMLELSRLERGKSVFKKEKVDISDVMKEVALKYGAAADDMGIAFVNKSDGYLPAVYSCRDRLLQLFAILIDNALKYVPDENGRVEIDAAEKGGRILFSVSDNGCGIPAGSRPYVFERFYKADSSRSSAGSGLGLAIARAVCAGLGESLWLESETGGGTTFYFTAEKA